MATFLEAYAGCGSVTAAAAAVGESREAHYKRLDANAEYRKAFEALQDRVGQQLEDVLMDRAINGVKHQLFWRGKPVKTKNGRLIYTVEYDSQLAIVLLKRFRPRLYREHASIEHTGSINLVERLENARAPVRDKTRGRREAGELALAAKKWLRIPVFIARNGELRCFAGFLCGVCVVQTPPVQLTMCMYSR